MVDQGTSSPSEIVLLEHSHAEAGLGQASGRCNSADAGAWGGGKGCQSSRSRRTTAKAGDGDAHTYDNGGLLAWLLAHLGGSNRPRRIIITC